MTLTVDDPDALERSSEKTSQWIGDAAVALGTGDLHEAYATLKAVLHALRDGMTVQAAGLLAAELPDRLRWAFYEGWVPSPVPATYHDRDEFLLRVASEAELSGPSEASYAVAAGRWRMSTVITAAELDRVMSSMPGQVRCLFELSPR
jgi:uncharacterized protein (DUF2267 family)